MSFQRSNAFSTLGRRTREEDVDIVSQDEILREKSFIARYLIRAISNCFSIRSYDRILMGGQFEIEKLPLMNVSFLEESTATWWWKFDIIFVVPVQNSFQL